MRMFTRDEKAEGSMIGFSIGAIVVTIIALMLFSTMTASVMPTVIDDMNATTNTSGVGATWSDGMQGMWDMATLMTVVAVLAIPVAIVIRLIT